MLDKKSDIIIFEPDPSAVEGMSVAEMEIALSTLSVIEDRIRSFAPGDETLTFRMSGLVRGDSVIGYRSLVVAVAIVNDDLMISTAAGDTINVSASIVGIRNAVRSILGN